jgi:UDP-N-acetyl-D-mannosaminuronic acid transferase (WecB/TagA/CpsF family)
VSETDRLTMGAADDPRGLDEDRWSSRLAARLADILGAGRGAAVTWYNHASVSRAMDAQIDVGRFDYVGIDGSFFRRLVAPGMPRTSADLVLPLLLDLLPGCRVALIGSSRGQLEAASAVIEALPSRPTVVLTCDGYAELPSPPEMAERLLGAGAEVVVLGLGAPLQDVYALGLVDAGLTRQLLLTCGGWIDQVSQPDYYPAYAYRLRLNWLFRVLREPARLWRRYTVEGLRAYARRAELRAFLLRRGSRPFGAMVAACTTGSASDGRSQPPMLAA